MNARLHIDARPGQPLPGIWGVEELAKISGHFPAAFDTSLNAAKLLVPLGVLEPYFGRNTAQACAKWAIAALLLAVTVLTAVGIYGAATIRRLPVVL